MSEFKEVKCKCGKEMVWGVMDGKRIPLDPVPPVYFIKDIQPDGTPVLVRMEQDKAMVNHFSTCKFANDF